MKKLKKIPILILSLFVGLIVSVIVYFIILSLPVFLPSVSIWLGANTEVIQSYAIAGALIVFALTAHKIYKQLKIEWSSDNTQDT
jgi:flagellar basal body-associated protein FliL